MKSPATEKGFRAGEPPVNKGITLPPEILTPSEVQRLLRACSIRSFTGCRNRALLTMLYRAALRLNEALDLYPKDIDPESGRVRVLHGKKDKPRTVAMDMDAFMVVQRWMDRREAADIPRRAPLFCTKQGNRIHNSYPRTLLHRLAGRAGIEKRVHPHGLRHTCAAELMAEGVPMNVIQAFLGHSNASTTSRYLAHIAPQHVIDMARERAWKFDPHRGGSGGTDAAEEEAGS